MDRARGFRAALETLRDAVGRETEVQTLVTLLRIAEGPAEGVSFKELKDALGVGDSAVSRNVGMLGKTGYRNGSGTPMPGRGLVEASEDIMDRRSKRARLTGEGKALVNKVLRQAVA